MSIRTFYLKICRTEPPEAPSYYHRMDEIVTAIFARVDDQVLISNATGDIKVRHYSICLVHVGDFISLLNCW